MIKRALALATSGATLTAGSLALFVPSTASATTTPQTWCPPGTSNPMYCQGPPPPPTLHCAIPSFAGKTPDQILQLILSDQCLMQYILKYILILEPPKPTPRAVLLEKPSKPCAKPPIPSFAGKTPDQIVKLIVNDRSLVQYLLGSNPKAHRAVDLKKPPKKKK